MPDRQRRGFQKSLGRLALAALFAPLALSLIPSGAALAEGGQMTVFKSPYCGCCGKWVDYMRAEGFQVAVRDMDDIAAVKKMAGVPGQLESCHTASLDGYVIEGHVPANAVRRLLSGETAYRGISVPGMPTGSPGMEGGAAETYSVYGFDGSGKIEALMTVPAQ